MESDDPVAQMLEARCEKQGAECTFLLFLAYRHFAYYAELG